MQKRNKSLGKHMHAAWAFALLACVAFGDNFVNKALGLPQSASLERLGAGPRRLDSDQAIPHAKDDPPTRPDEQGVSAQQGCRRP